MLSKSVAIVTIPPSVFSPLPLPSPPPSVKEKILMARETTLHQDMAQPSHLMEGKGQIGTGYTEQHQPWHSIENTS